jgi:pimeloyl-ACP methyl ester carboxylesterase
VKRPVGPRTAGSTPLDGLRRRGRSSPASIAYATDKLAADIRGLIHARGAESALLLGHDWGGSVAWATAMNHPEVVDRLAILNAAHPRKLS